MDPRKKIVFLEPEDGAAFELRGIRVEQLLPRGACSQFSAYMVHMEPGQTKQASYHKLGEELYYVVSGEGTADLGGEKYQLKPGCFFRVPPNTVHSFVTGELPLQVLNFHSPPVFADQDNYFCD